MSNRVTFQVTKFVNLNEALKETSTAYGYRLFDDHEQSYDNSIEKSDLPTTPEEALDIIEEVNADLYNFICHDKGGFFFNESYVEVDEDGKIKEEAEA